MRISRTNGSIHLVGRPAPKDAAAITIGPVISVRSGHETSQRLMEHEEVHVVQWAKFGWLGFLTRYLSSYFGSRIQGFPHWAAYRRIPLECEAEWIARRQAAMAKIERVDSSQAG